MLCLTHETVKCSIFLESYLLFDSQRREMSHMCISDTTATVPSPSSLPSAAPSPCPSTIKWCVALHWYELHTNGASAVGMCVGFLRYFSRHFRRFVTFLITNENIRCIALLRVVGGTIKLLPSPPSIYMSLDLRVVFFLRRNCQVANTHIIYQYKSFAAAREKKGKFYKWWGTGRCSRKSIHWRTGLYVTMGFVDGINKY